MQIDILQKFLDQGLLDLGEDPEKFNYLKAAAGDVAKKLQENRQSMISGSSVLLGGELADNEPILELCKDAITAHWPTYRSRFSSSTTQLFRAILLQAIAQITEQDSDHSFAAIIFYTTGGMLSYLTTEKEEAIFREFLLDLGAGVEAEAALVWAASKDVPLPNIKYETGPATIPVIDAKTLKEAIKNAAGPSGGTGANPEWPSANTPTWLEHFGQGTATALAAAVAAVLKDLVPTIVAKTRSDNGTAVEALKGALTNGAGDNLRADILYWKESLYSSGRKVSYRQLSADGAVYWLARDLHARVPAFHPHSVEFFLRETVRAAIGDKEAKKKLTSEQFCAAIVQDSELIELTRDLVPGQRLTLLEAVQGAAAKRVDAHAASAQTGIPAQIAIPRDEIAVLLFRDFQARRLAGGN